MSSLKIIQIFLFINLNFIETKEQKLKRLSIENDKLIEDSNNFKSSNKIVKTFDGTKSNTNNEVDFLKRQIKQLEDKLKRQQQQRSVAEKPYVDRKQFQKEDEAFEEAYQKSRSKVSHNKKCFTS